MVRSGCHVLVVLLLFGVVSGAWEKNNEHIKGDYGGNSSEFKHVNFDWRKWEAKCSRDFEILTWNKTELEKDLNGCRDIVEKFELELRRITCTSRITCRIDSCDNVIDRLEKADNTFQLLDELKKTVVSCRVEQPANVTEVGKLVNLVRGIAPGGYSFESQDCIGVQCSSSPGDPSRKYGQDGYRKAHVYFTDTSSTSEFCRTVQVQVETPSMRKWSDWAYENLYKNDTGALNDTVLAAYALDLSDYLYKRDKGYTDSRFCDGSEKPKCPDNLSNSQCYNWANVLAPAKVMLASLSAAVLLMTTMLK